MDKETTIIEEIIMTVKQAVKENKFISIIIGTIAAALLTWGVWVTDASYKVHYVSSVITERGDMQIKSLYLNIDELRLFDRWTIQEFKEQKEKINTNHEKVYLMLLDIRKEIKNVK